MMESLGFIALCLAGGLILWNRWQTKHTMQRLDEMLTSAMNGNFTEKVFDESRLSALESRLSRYLSASSLSARKIQEQKDQISALISDISHQTKTPVSNLLLYTQLLLEQPLTPQGQDCAQAISAQTMKLQSLIQALVKTSRLETGILALHPEKGEIQAMVSRAVGQYRPKAQEKGIVFETGPFEGTAVFDAKWTEEALCNLLDNAVKYTCSGGKIQVKTENYEMFSAISVTDTGLGISETEQAEIFGRFYRSPSVYQQEGLGIGLYLARQISQAQGGYIKVKSAPGQGSTFFLFLPRP